MYEDSANDTPVSQDEINAILQKACDTFRGTIAPSDYKNYILVMLFLKYISDVWREDYEKYRQEYPGDPEQVKRKMQFERFLIPDGADFYAICEQRNADNLGQIVDIALEAIESANKEKLDGVFRNISFNSETVLRKTTQRNELLKNLLHDFANPRLNLGQARTGNSNIAGEAFDFVMMHLPSIGSYRGGEYYIPTEICELLVKLLDPQPGDRIYDPVCRLGSTLIQCARHVGSDNYNLWGQELDSHVLSWSILRLYMHGIDQFHLEVGNPLVQPLVEKDGELLRFNVVVTTPPFSMPDWGAEAAKSDRFGRFYRGIPPKNNADYAFISHAIETAFADPDQNGRIGIVAPQGILFRGGKEAEIRQKIIEEGLLDAVISLPPNVLYGTSIPIVILILKRKKSDEHTLFVNGTHFFEKSNRQNRLSAVGISQILEAVQSRKNVTNYSYLATYSDFEENAFNLNVARYFQPDSPLPSGQKFRFISNWNGPHDVFISYSRQNNEEMQWLYDALTEAGLRVWNDAELTPGTADWQLALERAIEDTAVTVAILSPSAKQSEWVKRELTYSNIHKKPIFSILVEGSQQTSLPILLSGSEYADAQQDRKIAIEALCDEIRVHIGGQIVRSPYLELDRLLRNNRNNDWKRIALEHCVQFIRPIRDPRSVTVTREGEYPLYTQDGIERTDRFQYDGEYLLIYSKFSGISSSPQDIIRRASGKFSVKQPFWLLQTQDHAYLPYLYYFLLVTDLRKLLEEQQTPRLSVIGLRNLPIYLPSLPFQIEIADEIEKELDTNKAQRERLAKRMAILEDHTVGIVHRSFTEKLRPVAESDD